MPADSSSTIAIPTVDLSSFADLSDGKADQRAKASKDLYDACHKLGFAYIKGHGLPTQMLEDAFRRCHDLFNLPEEEKMKAPHPKAAIPHRGYSRPGVEKVYSKDDLEQDEADSKHGASLRKIEDLKESYEIGSEQNSAQPNIWLPEPVFPGFRSFGIKLYGELNKVTRRILEAFSMSLGLSKQDRETFLRLHSGTNNQLRLLHYPPVDTEKLRRQLVSRMPAHQDWSSFTIVFQDDVGGLELRDPNNHGTYLRATPPRGTCILNVGDMLQVFSNDIFKSAMHRVTLPFSQTTGQSPSSAPAASRYSIPYFVAPDHNATVFCLPSCVYKPFKWCEYNGKMSKYMYEEGSEKKANRSDAAGKRDERRDGPRNPSPRGGASSSPGGERRPSPMRTASPDGGKRGASGPSGPGRQASPKRGK